MARTGRIEPSDKNRREKTANLPVEPADCGTSVVAAERHKMLHEPLF